MPWKKCRGLQPYATAPVKQWWKKSCYCSAFHHLAKKGTHLSELEVGGVLFPGGQVIVVPHRERRIVDVSSSIKLQPLGRLVRGVLIGGQAGHSLTSGVDKIDLLQVGVQELAVGHGRQGGAYAAGTSTAQVLLGLTESVGVGKDGVHGWLHELVLGRRRRAVTLSWLQASCKPCRYYCHCICTSGTKHSGQDPFQAGNTQRAMIQNYNTLSDKNRDKKHPQFAV